MRRAMRKKRGKAEATSDSEVQSAAPIVTTKRAAVKLLSTNFADADLEQLELLIDDCFVMAKTIDPDGLEHVIHLLRKARNEVVWKLGGGDE
jgi:hypothetical protein